VNGDKKETEMKGVGRKKRVDHRNGEPTAQKDIRSRVSMPSRFVTGNQQNGKG
jgi:hypothetical protein